MIDGISPELRSGTTSSPGAWSAGSASSSSESLTGAGAVPRFAIARVVSWSMISIASMPRLHSSGATG